MICFSIALFYVRVSVCVCVCFQFWRLSAGKDASRVWVIKMVRSLIYGEEGTNRADAIYDWERVFGIILKKSF